MADIGLAAIPILLIGNTAPHDTLTKRKPTRHLFSFIPMLSLVSFLFFQVEFTYFNVNTTAFPFGVQ